MKTSEIASLTLSPNKPLLIKKWSTDTSLAASTKGKLRIWLKCFFISYCRDYLTYSLVQRGFSFWNSFSGILDTLACYFITNFYVDTNIYSSIIESCFSWAILIRSKAILGSRTSSCKIGKLIHSFSTVIFSLDWLSRLHGGLYFFILSIITSYSSVFRTPNPSGTRIIASPKWFWFSATKKGSISF